ncbi:MAG: hypothetical protein ACP59X_04985 [Solidesulfovibrio sp. DCME]|uniref:hypothetical protein n=1 Tax=Solidesulfovibrio sp. DCME TaxID=3447380 RepID=UPI003D0D4C06
MRAIEISNIIQKRNLLAKSIADKAIDFFSLQKDFVEMKKIIEELKNKDNTPSLFVDDNFLDDLDSAAETLSEVQMDFEKALKRFDRNSLNIVVVGRARNGKSRLLQSLTSLSSTEIPDGNKSFCTAVRSDIINSEEVSKAKVHFYTKANFMEKVIAQYFDSLRLPLPRDFDEFKIYKMPDACSASDTHERNWIEHLLEIQRDAPKYESFLGAVPSSIATKEVRSYVTQDGDSRTFHSVEKVEIFCKFPNTNAHQLRLIDLPGLGETGLGGDKRVVETIGPEADVVLFVRMPSDKGDSWTKEDVDLYSIASQGFSHSKLEDCSFQVLNSTKNPSNFHNCEQMKSTMQVNHLYTVDSIIADCSNGQEACEKILNQIISYLKDNIYRIDQSLCLSLQDKFDFCAEQGERLRVKLVSFVNSHANSAGNEFIRLCQSTIDNLKESLQNLITNIRVYRNDPSEDFKEGFSRILNEATNDMGIDEQLLSRLIPRLGGSVNAYGEAMHIVRTHLSRRFLDLDKTLNAPIQRVKNEIVSILARDGALGNYFTNDDTLLEDLMAFIRKQNVLSDLKDIYEALQLLETFHLSYRGLIQHRIRQFLDPIDGMSLEVLPMPEDDKSSERIYEHLNTIYSEILFEMRRALNDISQEPNRAVFAIAEEFKDIAIRSTEVELQWFFLYNLLKNDLWPDKFSPLEGGSRLKNRVDELSRNIQSHVESKPNFLLH